MTLGLLVVLIVRSGPDRPVRASTGSTVCRVLNNPGCGTVPAPVSAPVPPGDGGVGGSGAAAGGGPGSQGGGAGTQGRTATSGGDQTPATSGQSEDEGLLDTVLTSAFGAVQATGDFLRAAANTLWHVGRLGINSTVTFLAWLYAESRGADCRGSPGLIVACVNARPQGFWQSTTFQVGNLTLSSEARVDPVVQGHETRHADQGRSSAAGWSFPCCTVWSSCGSAAVGSATCSNAGLACRKVATPRETVGGRAGPAGAAGRL